MLLHIQYSKKVDRFRYCLINRSYHVKQQFSISNYAHEVKNIEYCNYVIKYINLFMLLSQKSACCRKTTFIRIH